MDVYVQFLVSTYASVLLGIHLGVYLLGPMVTFLSNISGISLWSIFTLKKNYYFLIIIFIIYVFHDHLGVFLLLMMDSRDLQQTDSKNILKWLKVRI